MGIIYFSGGRVGPVKERIKIVDIEQ